MLLYLLTFSDNLSTLSVSLFKKYSALGVLMHCNALVYVGLMKGSFAHNVTSLVC